MLARMSLLALCAVAAIAIGAAAVPFKDGPSTEACIRQLAARVKSIAVPEEISALTAALEADVPYSGSEDWDELDDEVRAKHAAHYPAESCYKLLEQLGNICQALIKEEACLTWQLGNSVHGVKLSEKNPDSGPIMKVGRACEVLMPDQEDDQE